MSDVYEAYDVQRVKNAIANSEELVTLLQKLLEKPPQGDPPHILALRRALSATIVQWEQMERTGEEYRPSIELSDLWFDAAFYASVRAAGQSRFTRQTSRRGRVHGAWRGRRRELRGAEIRGAIRDALCDRESAMPGPYFREAAVRGLQRDLATHTDDLRRTHGNHRAAIA
jgi:hypothetical protein